MAAEGRRRRAERKEEEEKEGRKGKEEEERRKEGRDSGLGAGGMVAWDFSPLGTVLALHLHRQTVRPGCPCLPNIWQ